MKLSQVKIVKNNLIKNNKHVYNFVFPKGDYNDRQVMGLLKRYISQLLKNKPHLKDYDAYISSLYPTGYYTGTRFKLNENIKLFSPASRYKFLAGESIKRFLLIVSAPKQ